MTDGVFVHPGGICETPNVGTGTRVWAFAHVLPGARMGRDCNICDHVFIENDVVLGDRVTVKCGVQLWDGLRVGDDVFIGPNATFTNDRFPRSKRPPERFIETRIARGASIGAGAVVLPGLNIGEDAMVGAGAVVTRSVPPYAIVVGNPARIIGYADTVVRTGPAETVGIVNHAATTALGIADARLVRFPQHADIRGSLTAGNFAGEIPFIPKRFFIVHGVPSRETRGEHAHRVCHQFLVCSAGQVSVVVDDGKRRLELCLDSPHLGLYLPAMTWGIQYKYSPDAVLVVFASEPYDPADYIRDYREFQTLAAHAGNTS
jgi:acetyltransferase-like isoleucine patch superfamily enzyme